MTGRLEIPLAKWRSLTDDQKDAIRHAAPCLINWQDQPDGTVTNAGWADRNGQPTDVWANVAILVANGHDNMDVNLRTVIVRDPTKVPTRQVVDGEKEPVDREALRLAYEAERDAEIAKRLTVDITPRKVL